MNSSNKPQPSTLHINTPTPYPFSNFNVGELNKKSQRIKPTDEAIDNVRSVAAGLSIKDYKHINSGSSLT